MEEAPSSSASSQTGNDTRSKLKEKANSYYYTPLRTDIMQIRVLAIHPRETEGPNEAEPVRCSLRTVGLEDWTREYQRFRSKCPSDATSRARLICWDLYTIHARLTHQDPSKKGPELAKQLLEAVHFDTIDVKPTDSLERIPSRFKWGDFVALSYVWGDLSNKQVIWVDGHRFPVTSNLHQALLCLRELPDVRELKRHVWVDAICINQNDDVEKAHQVAKMGAIYSGCCGVKAWLGCPKPNIEADLVTLRTVFASCKEESQYCDKLAFVGYENEALARSVVSVASSLFSEPYWERVWVIQEMALAAQINFYYGRQVLACHDFIDLLICISNPKSASTLDLGWTAKDSYFAAVERIKTLDGYQPPSLHLHSLVTLAQSAKSLDPRDKVFGFLGMLPENISVRLHPRYDPTYKVDDAILELSKAVLEVDGTLRPLAHIDACRSGISSSLPSWTLPLEAHTCGFVGKIGMFQSDRFFKSDFEMPPAELSISNDNRIVSCNGILIDTVNSLAGVTFWNRESRDWDTCGPEQADAIEKDTSLLCCDWKRAIARVFIQDASYEFSEGLTLLDMYWEDKVIDQGIMDTLAFLLSNKDGFRMLCRSHLMLTKLRYLLSSAGDFEVGGRPLKTYFAAKGSKALMLRPDDAAKVILDCIPTVGSGRLAKTQRGLLGSVPQSTQIGDRVAILAGCDKPMLLRHHGQHFRIVGGCFIEGYMMGEAAKELKAGRVQMQTISIC